MFPGGNQDGSRVLTFPTSVSAVKHEEWEMMEILAYIGLMTDTQQGRSAVGTAITEFHFEMGYLDRDKVNDTKPEVFLKVRPDGVAFNWKAKICAFLEFTRQMDSPRTTNNPMLLKQRDKHTFFRGYWHSKRLVPHTNSPISFLKESILMRSARESIRIPNTYLGSPFILVS